jgi:hypothetical protein
LGCGGVQGEHQRRQDSGTIGIAIRGWRRQAKAIDFGQPTAATTRWRVTARPTHAGAGWRPFPVAARIDPVPQR